MSADKGLDRESVLYGAAGYLIQELGQRGITAEAIMTEHGRALQLEGMGMLSMENVADDLMTTPPSQWETMLQRWVQFAVEASQTRSAPKPSADELLSLVRTRIIATADADSHSYGRPVVEGLFQVLSLDYPTHVVTLTDADIGDLEVSLDVLFDQGQINTDAEPIDETFSENGVRCVTGDSMFIASKIGNIPALLGRLGVEAPDGLLFAVPNRSLLMYSLPTREEGLGGIVTIAQMVDSFTLEAGFNNPGGLLSRNVFYWAPDGAIEPQMSSYQEVHDRAASHGQDLDLPEEHTLVIQPGAVFSRRFIMGLE